MKMRLICFTAAALATAFFTLEASALVVVPGDATYSGNVPNNPDASDVEAITGDSPLTELYKQDVGGGESGSLAGSYSTTFSNTPTDPQDATVTYDGGQIVNTASPAWLLVKDGNSDPIWYLIDLGAVGWNGQEILELQGFWPNQGSISHISFFGTAGPPTGGPPIPEAGAFAIWGIIGMTVFGLGRRRKQNL